MPRTIAVVCAVLMSGAAGLMYQVAWARRLTSVTSVSVTAQALVLAVFMAGLGLGAALAGRRSGRLRRPGLGYAAVEIAAAALAVLSFPLIAASEGIRTGLFALGVPLSTGLYVQLACTAAYLLLPTTLLGASLPLLIEHSERDRGDSSPSRRGRLVSALYGFNAAGAVAGSLLSGFHTIENYGLTRTGLIGAALAVGAASLVALTTGGRGRTSTAAPAAQPAEWSFLAAAALAGFVGIGAEVLWIRLFGMIVNNTVYAYSQVVIAVLVGIVAGSALAGLLARRPALRHVVLISAAAAFSVALVPYVVAQFAGATSMQVAVAGGRSLLSAVWLLGGLLPASALVASVLPLLVTASRRTSGSRAFGAIYAANTVGSVAGSLAVGFVLIPFLGVRASTGILALGCLGVGALMLSRLPDRRIAIAVLALGLLVTGLLTWRQASVDELYGSRLPDDARIVDAYEGAGSHVMVTEEPRSGVRQLWINSMWVASSAGQHAALGHLPALLIDTPRRALGIALGTGQSFAAVLQHGVSEMDCVEIDRGVLAMTRRWFTEANGGLLDDHRVHVVNDDGRAFMRATSNRYDVIVLEPLQAWSAGTSNLYSKEFYEEAQQSLSAGGILSQWIPFYGQGVEETRTMVRTGLAVFRHGALWLVGRDGVLLLSDEPLGVSVDELRERIRERDLAQELTTLPAGSTIDLLAFHLLGREGLFAWADGAEILEDDRPFLEFRAATQIGIGEQTFSETLQSIRPYLDDLATYFTGAQPAHLAAAQSVRDAVVAALLVPDTEPERRVELLERVPAGARQIALWRLYYRAAIRAWLEAADPASRESIRRRAERYAGS